MTNKVISIVGFALLILTMVAVFIIANASGWVDRQLATGQKHINEGNYEEAISILEEVIEAEPENPEAYLKMAQIKLMQKENDEAIKILEEGIKKTGNEEIRQKLDSIDIKREKIYLRLAETHFDDYPTTLADKMFSQLVYEKSNGRIEIEVFANKMLGEETVVIEKVMDGAIDFTRVSTAPMAEINPELNVLCLPYIFKNRDCMWKVLEGEVGKEILDSIEESGSGFVGLCWYDGGQRSFYSSSPINSMADLKGKYIRVQENHLMFDLTEAVGAIPNPMVFAEVYSALKTGVIDGAENNLPNYLSTAHHEVAPYYICDGHTRIPEILVASKDTMDKLTKEERKIIKEAAWESMYYQREKWAEKSDSARAEVEAAFCTIVEPTEEEMQEFQSAVLPIYKEYADEHMELIEKIKKAQDEDSGKTSITDYSESKMKELDQKIGDYDARKFNINYNITKTERDKPDFNTTKEIKEGEMWFKLAEVHSYGYPTTLADEEFARLVNEKTDGRINIEVHANAELGDEYPVIEKVQMGAIDFARVSTAPMAEFIPALNVLHLPYIYKNGDHMWRVLESDVGKEILESPEADGTGFVGLCWYDGGQRSFYSSSPINNISDLKGKKIRVQENKFMCDIVDAVGAVPNPMAFGEVYSALQTGVIDASENNFPTYLSMGHYEVAPHYICDGHTRIPEILVASKDVMDKISEEDRQAIKDAAWESMEFQKQKWAQKSDSARAKVEAAGCTVVEPTEEEMQEFQDAVLPLYEEYAADYMEIVEKILSID